jgi:hypothetical protein
MPLLRQLFASPRKSAFGEEWEFIGFFPKGYHAKVPVAISGACLKPSSIKLGIVGCEQFDEFLPVSTVSAEQQLCRSSNLLGQVAHSTRLRNDFREHQGLCVRV